VRFKILQALVLLFALASQNSKSSVQLLLFLYAGYFDVCKGPAWWRKAAAVLELLQPFCDAIHQLEADKPLLSQVKHAWACNFRHSTFEA